MKVLYLTCFILIIMSAGIKGQEAINGPINSLFTEQLSLYPQEKIYVQTDRNVYMSGETVWFRAHLVDALFLKQANASRYVYVELINPLNDIVQRIKIRPDSIGCFYGHVLLEEDLPEGNYVLRAYTWFMQNQGEDYFFRKSIYITDPIREKISPEVTFRPDNNQIKAEISFVNKVSRHKVIPEQCLVFPDGDPEGKGIPLRFEDEKAAYTFKEKEINAARVILLQTLFDGTIYNSYFNIPAVDNTFHVDFFPEGGHVPFSTNIKMAFKAINADGLSEEIEGEIFDDRGQAYSTFSSFHLGMGHFRMYYDPQRTYYAICKNKDNVSKRFDLPAASLNAVSLNTMWRDEYLRVTLAKSPQYELPEGLKVIAHIRGAVIYEEPWEESPGYLVFERDFFPAGIIHFILIDGSGNIVSERLVFSSQESTFGLTDIQPDKDLYQPREQVTMAIRVSDENNEPLSGNFSIAVVDRKDVEIDTTSTLISTLLLSSELKGHIENPMSYLKGSDKRAALALDVLMMTQGWRRYTIPDLIKGDLTRELSYGIELSDEVTGRVEGVFSALKEGTISLLAYNDSVLGTSLAQPDSKGVFTFKDLEYPEGTKYIIQALTKKNSKKVFLEVEPLKTFPDITVFPAPVFHEEPLIEDTYISKMNQKYTIENGMRVYNLAEVVITGKNMKRLPTQSPYYSVSSSRVLTEKDVEQWRPLSVLDLLRRIPGITVLGNEVRYRTGTPMVIVDNVPEDGFNYEDLDVNDVKDVFVSPPESSAPIFGGRAAFGAVIINTKKGFVQKNRMSSNIRIVQPVGYQQAVEFYSPVYATKEEKNSSGPDLRSTIYWNPNVQVDSSGIAEVSFYAADPATHYGVVLEGVSSQGHLINSSQKTIEITE